LTGVGRSASVRRVTSAAPPRPGRVLADLESAAAALAGSRVIAVLGAHRERWRPAFYVPDYLHRQGFTVLPVNPRFAGERLWGEACRGHLGELDRPVDLVDVFRPAHALPAHVEELLAMRPAPRIVWLQLGIRHDAVTARLTAAGVDVVQDRCTLADHRAAQHTGAP